MWLVDLDSLLKFQMEVNDWLPSTIRVAGDSMRIYTTQSRRYTILLPGRFGASSSRKTLSSSSFVIFDGLAPLQGPFAAGLAHLLARTLAHLESDEHDRPGESFRVEDNDKCNNKGHGCDSAERSENRLGSVYVNTDYGSSGQNMTVRPAY